MPDDALIPIPREMLLEACAQAALQALKESGLLADLADAQAVLTEVRLLKEGLLTKEQAAGMLQISVRTFKRQVAAGLWPELRRMGGQEYRYPLPGILASLYARDQWKRAAHEGEPLNDSGRQRAA